MFRKLVVVFAASFLTAIAFAAHAQTNYPVQVTIEVRDSNGQDPSVGAGVAVGDPLNVRATAWLALSDVRAQFFSTPIELGTYKADKNGVLKFTFNVPNVEPGMHTLRLSGTGNDNKPRVVEAPIKVRAASTGTGAGAGTGNGTATGAGTGSATGSSTGSGSAATGSGSQVLGRAVANASAGSSSRSVFGKTGANIVPILEVGLAMLAAGTALVLAVRKRHAVDTLSR